MANRRGSFTEYGTVSFVDLDSMQEVAVVETGEVPLGLTFTGRRWVGD